MSAPCDYIAIPSRDLLPRLIEMHSFVELCLAHRAALVVQKALSEQVGLLWWKRKRTLDEAYQVLEESAENFSHLHGTRQLLHIRAMIRTCQENPDATLYVSVCEYPNLVLNHKGVI